MSARIDIAFHPAPAVGPAKNSAAGAGSLISHDLTAGRTPMVEQPGPRCFGPIETTPRGLRPPYAAHDPEMWAYCPGERAEDRRERRLAARREVLLEPLEGIEVGDFEGRILDWLADWEDSTIAVIAAWLHRARAAAPLAEGGHAPTGGEH